MEVVHAYEQNKILHFVCKVRMLARNVFDIAKRRYLDKKCVSKPILNRFSHMTHQIEA